MNYHDAYEMILELEHELQDALRNYPPYLDGPDYKTVQALAAAYELHEYVANKVADEDVEEEAFAEMMQRMAAEQGAQALAENERLKNDPNFTVPETLHKKCMELLGG